MIPAGTPEALARRAMASVAAGGGASNAGVSVTGRGVAEGEGRAVAVRAAVAGADAMGVAASPPDEHAMTASPTRAGASAHHAEEWIKGESSRALGRVQIRRCGVGVAGPGPASPA